MAKTVDLTPTWTGILPALIALAQHGHPAGLDELTNMAQAADAAVAAQARIRKMKQKIREQKAGVEEPAAYILGDLSEAQLDLVLEFISSFGGD